MKQSGSSKKLPLGRETALFLSALAGDKRCAAATISAYRSDLSLFREYAKDMHLLQCADISAKDLEHFIAYLYRQNHISARSAARKVSSLRAFFRFLHSEGICKTDPARKLESVQYQKAPPRIFSIAEVNELFRAAEQMNDSSGISLRAMLELLYSAGLRISETVELKLSALTFADADTNRPEPYITVSGKGGKQRKLPLIPSAQDALEAHIALRMLRDRSVTDPYLFPSMRSAEGHITRQGVAKMLKKLAVTASLPAESVHPHALRHAFASHLLQNGAALETIKELLGHSDISSTQIYTHIRPGKQDELTEKHPLIAD